MIPDFILQTYPFRLLLSVSRFPAQVSQTMQLKQQIAQISHVTYDYFPHTYHVIAVHLA
jgi:hypothetical protein